MNSSIKTLTLDKAILQENGIIRLSDGLLIARLVDDMTMQQIFLRINEQKLNEVLPELKPDQCGICGGKKVEIRGKYPKDAKRTVCPTCMQERLEQINDISNSDYGKTCKS